MTATDFLLNIFLVKLNTKCDTLFGAVLNFMIIIRKLALSIGGIMKAARVTLLKKELNRLESPELVAICLRLAKFKAENKELLSYLLFHSSDEPGYCKDIQWEMKTLFAQANTSSSYLFKKTVRKVQRYMNKSIRISDVKTTELELRIYFLKLLSEYSDKIRFTRVVWNLYDRELERLDNRIERLHPDIQNDYRSEIEHLRR